MGSIDYGNGITNIDLENGVRYGIIPSNSVNQDAVQDIVQNGTDLAYESWKEERDSALKSAVDCLGDFIHDKSDIDLDDLADYLGISSDFMESGPWDYEDEEYKLHLDEHNDLWVLKSPYVTNRGFCSPCAPGACHLESDGDALCYCLGSDWFDDDFPCPYEILNLVDVIQP